MQSSFAGPDFGVPIASSIKRVFVEMNDRDHEKDLDFLRQKRRALLEELHSDEHYENVEAIAFGSHDPFDVPVASCEACGRQRLQPRMSRVKDKPARWVMVCHCERKSKVIRKRPWETVLEWNAINLAGFNYQEMPLFGLSKLSPSDAHKRLTGIRRNLELRKNIIGLERNIGQRTRDTGEMEVPGKTFQERIEAYLGWCLWGLRLTKLAKNNSDQP